MTEAPYAPVEVVDAIARCAQVLDEPERLREEVAQLRELPGDTVSFAVALFELERARRGDPEAREGIGTVAESLLTFWQDKRGDEIATQHPALELLWADASALMVSFEVRRFDRVLTECWEARENADALAAAIERLKPDGNRRVEFARCLYHLELARLGRTSSRTEFARRAGLLQEAYPDPKVAAELVGSDDGLAHLWKELVPYLDEFFEMLEEQQAKAAAAKAAAEEAKLLADAMPAVTPMPQSTAPAPPPRVDVVTEPVAVPEPARVEDQTPPPDKTPPPDATPPPDKTPPPDQTPPPAATEAALDQSSESVAVHRAPVSDDTMVEIDHSAPTPPPPPPLAKPGSSKADDILRAHLEAPEEEHWKVSSEAVTDPPGPALKRQRDNIVTDQVPALVPAAPPDIGLDSTLPPEREMGNVSGVFDLWLTTQAESADIEVVEAEPSAPPPAPAPPRPPEESAEIELADVIETIPAPPVDVTPAPLPKRRVSSSGIIDLQQALKDSKAQAEAKTDATPPPLEPRYQPDPAALAFWRYSEQALGLLPPGDGPRLEARVLSGEGRAERKKLNGYSDEVLRRFESVPEARAFACLLRLYLAAQMKEKSLFGGVNAKRKEAFRAALQLLSPEPLAAGHVAVWFELDGKQTTEILQDALEQVTDFLQFCARSGLDPLDPTAADQFLP